MSLSLNDLRVLERGPGRTPHAALVRYREVSPAELAAVAATLEGAEILDARRFGDGFVKIGGSWQMDKRGPGRYLVIPMEDNE